MITAKALIDDLNAQIRGTEADLAGISHTHPYVRLLDTAPGIGPVLGYTIASEIGDIGRFETPRKLAGYTGLCPRVHQSGRTDRRGPLATNGPRYLRWALIEAAVHALVRSSTGTTTATPVPGSAVNAAPRSPVSKSPASSAKRSGTCSPAGNHSPRQAPPQLWPPEGPLLNCATGTVLPYNLIQPTSWP